MDLFDEQEAYKRKLEDYTSMNISDDLSWDKMGPAILEGVEKRKKRRRFFLWWWLGSILLFLSFSLIIWGLEVESPSTNTSAINSTVQKEKIIAEPSRERVDKNEEKFMEESNLVTTDRTKEEMVTKNALDVIENNKERSTTNSYQQKEKTVISNFKESNTQLSYKTNEKSTKKKNILTITESKTVANALINTNTNIFIPIQKNKEQIINDSLVQHADSQEFKRISPIKKLPILFASLLSIDNIYHIPPLSKKQVATFSKWQLAITGGINWWQQELVAPNKTDSLNVSFVGWQLNTRINRHFGKRWTATVGLQLQNLRYKSAFNHTEGTNVYQPGTIDAIFINSLTGGQSITFRDSIPGVRTRNFQHHNRHLSVQVPLLVGFTLGKKRWKYSVHTGFGLQIFRQNIGRIALEKGQVIDLPNNRLYPTKVALSHLIEIQLSYQITKNWSVLGNINRESHFTNWLSKDAPFQQQPKVFSSSLGVAWSF